MNVSQDALPRQELGRSSAGGTRRTPSSVDTQGQRGRDTGSGLASISGSTTAIVPIVSIPTAIPAVCACGLVPREWVSRTETNPGRRFLRCPMPRGRQCEYFRWMDGADEAPVLSGRANVCTGVLVSDKPSESAGSCNNVPAASDANTKVEVPEVGLMIDNRGRMVVRLGDVNVAELEVHKSKPDKPSLNFLKPPKKWAGGKLGMERAVEQAAQKAAEAAAGSVAGRSPRPVGVWSVDDVAGWPVRAVAGRPTRSVAGWQVRSVAGWQVRGVAG